MNLNLLLEKIKNILERIKAKEGDLRSASLTIEAHFSPTGDLDIHYSLRKREPVK